MSLWTWFLRLFGWVDKTPVCTGMNVGTSHGRLEWYDEIADLGCMWVMIG